MGQKSAIALEWSEQIELSPGPEKNKRRGRPKGALSEAAKEIGINEQRVFEVRQIRDANPTLYREVKAGSRSLNSALAEISPSRETGSYRSDLDNYSESASRKPDYGARNAKGDGTGKSRLIDQSANGQVERGIRKPADKKTATMAKAPPSRAAAERALLRIKEVLGSSFYGEVRGRNLIQKAEEIVRFAKLTDTQTQEIGSLLKRGWAFGAAFQEVVERLTSGDEIRALHARSLANGVNWYISSVGSFGHIVAWGPEKDKILARLKETLEGYPFHSDLDRRPGYA